MKDHEHTERELTSYVSVEEHIADVRAKADGLAHAMVEVEMYPDYGGDRVRMFVSGYRKLTPVELRDRAARERKEREQAEERDRAQLAKLLERYGAPE